MKSVVCYLDGWISILPRTNALVGLKGPDGQESVIVFSKEQARELVERYPPMAEAPAAAEAFLGQIRCSTLPPTSTQGPVTVAGILGGHIHSTIGAAFKEGIPMDMETTERGVVHFWLPPTNCKEGLALCIDARGHETLECFYSRSQARKIVRRLSGLTAPAYERNIVAGIERTDLPEESADAPVSVDGAVAQMYRMAAQALMTMVLIEHATPADRRPRLQ